MAIKNYSMRSPHHHTVRPGMAVKRSFNAPRHVRVCARPRGFGRGRAWNEARVDVEEKSWKVSEELRLFGMTFAAGFLFVSVLIG